MLVSNDEAVSIHTPDGIVVYQFRPGDYTRLKWGRELRDVSRCEVALPAAASGRFLLPDIAPWLHTVHVWDGAGNLLWRGPVQKVEGTRSEVFVSARDAAAYAARTRVPLTKRWEAVDPCVPAGEMWERLVGLHRLNVAPVTRPDPEGDRFDYQVTADAAMMDSAMTDLVGLGLRWTVVTGIPLLGPVPRDPVVTLGENDFLGDLGITRDGTATFNDVLLRGPDTLARARTDLYGLNLQTIVNVDSMFGVSNVDRASQQYAKHTAAIRDAITMDSGARLHPDAPVTLDQLIPSARFVIDVYGVRALMELESMEVTIAQDDASVTVKMESVLAEVPELMEQQQIKDRVTV